MDNFGAALEIEIDENYEAMCPQCKCKFKQLVKHLKNKTDCRLIIEDFEKFKKEYQLFAHRRRKNVHRRLKLQSNPESLHQVEASHSRNHRKRNLENDATELHRIEATHSRNQRQRKLENDAVELHRVEATHSRNQRQRNLENDAVELHRVEATHSRNQRQRKLENDAVELHRVEATHSRKQRQINLENDGTELHRVEATHSRKQRQINLENDGTELHRVEATHSRKQRQINLEENPLKLRREEATFTRNQRKSKLKNDPMELHRVEAKYKRNQTIDKQKRVTASDRLRKFKRAVLFGPIFVCSCCHVKHFESWVTRVDESFQSKILEKYPNCFTDCVRDFVTVAINAEAHQYFCNTCITYMKSGRIPPMSVCNGLDIIHSNDPELQLSELENNLIALRIMFQKIYYLPKSRWTALKDRVINIPIEKDNVINTIKQLPRLPAESGLVEVKLKRKIEYKNVHKNEYVDPNKIFKALEYLRAKGHPGYKDFNTREEYMDRCKETDKEGYQSIFEPDDDVDEVFEQLDPMNVDEITEVITDELNDMETETLNDELYYKENDPVAKFQFDYDRSTCLTEKYPEVTVPEDTHCQEFCFAPGEGKYPADILMDKSWDVNAFPLLHPDGKYGLNEKREITVKLTDQSYFKQRIRNKDSRFIDNKPYLYSAVAYVERKQLQNNINLSYTKGKKSISADGTIQYELDDAFQVFENIKNTPRYWRKAKYEMLAKLDNLGPFQIFYTLSSADMRWNENFTSILRERDIKIQYDFDTLETKVEIVDAATNASKTKSLEEFLRDDIDESLHELIRTNVLTAVLNFNQRFTAFRKEIMFGDNNPMKVIYFSSKLEFQMRGAGHIHGTLWLDLNKLDHEEKIDAETDDELEISMYRFTGIKEIFRKIRRNQCINEDEADVLAKFTDAFTTCSLNPDEVGENVVKIAAKVNCHHHTFTCRKYCIRCRFNFPKYPMWKTIISRPRSEENVNVEKYTATLNKVKTLLECPELIEDIMIKYQKDKETKEEYNINRKKRILELLDIANVTENEYLEALGYSKAGYNVILKRDLDEIYINSYNAEWIEAWDGNIDVSICLDYYAVVTYITEYFCKTDSTMQELLKEAAKNIESNKSQRERKILLSNTFITHRQMGEAEAIYKLFPNLKLKDSNVTCVFLQTGKKEERSKFLTAMDKESNWHDKVGIQVKGKDGLVVEKPDMLDKYCRKHKSVGRISPSQFAKIYESTSKIPKKYRIDELDDGDESDTDDDNIDNKEELNEEPQPNKWHLVMTYKKEYVRPLPKYFKLDPVYPGEPAYMKRRDYPACLRFHKVKEHTNPQKFFKNEIMLYTYFQSEDDLDFDDHQWVQDKFKESVDGIKRNIQVVKEQVMEHLESVEEARYFVDELHKQQIEEAGEELDTQNIQDDMDCIEEGIAEHPDFAHLNPDELEIFEASSKKAPPMRIIETGSIDELIEKSRGHDKFQRKVVEIGLKYARGIVQARCGNHRFPEPVQLMVHGGAGSGKSTVIDALAKWIQHVIVQSGDDPQFPHIIKGGPTGAAASIIDGQTMHTLFNFSFGNEFYSLSDKIRDEKRLLYQNLNIIILDEISLVKSDMQFQLDLRLREVKMNDTVFGGVSLFVFGDIMQMRPVMGNYIFQKPTSKDYELAYLQGKHWQSFKIINLEENHRQGNDREYADVLNRIRIGEQTESDIELLRTRVRQPKDKDILEVENALYISATNKEVKKINDERMAKLDGDEFEAEAVHIHPTMKNYKPRIDKATGRIAKTGFVDKLKIKKGAKVMLIHNIDTVDGLTNGCMGKLIDVLKTKHNKIDKLIIEFTNPKHGEMKRLSNPALHRKFPNGTPIEAIMFSYTLSKKASGVGNTAKLVQFPICVAFATTCHKFQGQTVPRHLKLIIDLRHIWGPAMAYVMLSRVMELTQLFIIGELDEKKIYPDQSALEELRRMNEVSINNNPSIWNRERVRDVKISALNCRSLRSKINDIKKDFEFCISDMVCLSETWLNENDELMDLQIGNYSLHVNSIGCGKGLATYFRQEKFSHEFDIKENEIQISKFTSEELDVFSIYRSNNCQLNFEDVFEDLLVKDKPTLILGDMNICYQKQRRDVNIQYLESKQFKQLVKGATHLLGGQIDHAYFVDPQSAFTNVDVEQYSPYYTARDHNGLLITLQYKLTGKTNFHSIEV